MWHLQCECSTAYVAHRSANIARARQWAIGNIDGRFDFDWFLCRFMPRSWINQNRMLNAQSCRRVDCISLQSFFWPARSLLDLLVLLLPPAVVRRRCLNVSPVLVCCFIKLFMFIRWRRMATTLVCHIIIMCLAVPACARPGICGGAHSLHPSLMHKFK